MIKERLTTEIRAKGLPFTVIVDECTDPHSNQEVLSVSLRFVDLSKPDDPHIKECLVDFIYLERANAQMIASKILECLIDPSLALDPGKIRGLAYDGPPVMSSDKQGVQAKIKKRSPMALYTHCYCHCLNLSIAASCKVQEVRNLIGLINEVYLFLKNSPKRQKLFELVLSKYLPDCLRKKLPGLCKIRWVKRHTCFDTLLELYEIVVLFLDAIVSPNEYPDLRSSTGEWDWDTDTTVKAHAFKLQKRDQDVYEAYKIVDDVIRSPQDTGNAVDYRFAAWYSDIKDLAANIGVTESVPRKTALQRFRNNTPSKSLDSLISQMKERFSTDEGRYAHYLLSLIPSVIVSKNLNLTDNIAGLMKWEADMPFAKSLKSELQRWQVLWQGTTQRDTLPDNLLKTLAVCDEDSFPNIHSLLVIACTLPISSAEAERSFSLMRRIKT